LAATLLTAALLAAALFFTLPLFTFTLLSVAILLLSALLSGASGFAGFVWILLCVHDAFLCYGIRCLGRSHFAIDLSNQIGVEGDSD